jgi:hypothetical protein
VRTELEEELESLMLLELSLSLNCCLMKEELLLELEDEEL